jgi:hypothetical protein
VTGDITQTMRQTVEPTAASPEVAADTIPIEGRADTHGAVAAEGRLRVDVADAIEARRWLPSGWYLLGLAVQVFLWMLVFLGIAIAIGVGGHLTEFRYVGF